MAFPRGKLRLNISPLNFFQNVSASSTSLASIMPVVSSTSHNRPQTHFLRRCFNSAVTSKFDCMLTEREVYQTAIEMLHRAETTLPKDVTRALRRALRTEQNPISKLQLELMFKNLEIARKLDAPICQDTGTFTFFVRIGRKLILNFDLREVITRAVAEATKKIPLRVNVVDPITRKPMSSNTGKEQPTIHIELTDGNEFQMDLLVRGSGAENCGRLFMLGPTEGLNGIKQAVIATLNEAGGKPCPPTIVGVGIGGSMETACLEAKRALLRPLDKKNPDPILAKLEREIEVAANRLNIGAAGLGGKNTVLGVKIEKAASHTASLAVAIAMQCWVARRASAKLVNGKLRLVRS
ncbi:MAG TPA: fumarate hydratase [Hadesarchaea archaeon]|nr:fumarate hydratase [Hadesarchaea archaeon]